MSRSEADRLSVMIVDDEPTLREVMRRYLSGKGYDTCVFQNAEACLAAFAKKPADVVITDLRMPGMSGLELLGKLKECSTDTEVILITAYADKDAAIQALKRGAYDFFEKPVSLDQLDATIIRTIRYQAVVRERDRLAGRLAAISEQDAREWGVSAIKGSSPAMRGVLRRIGLLQNVDRTTVLLTGESGTGKELVARAIHFGSTRAERAFIPINCSAIPAELVESELFGHVKGSFTGAVSDRKGCFERANGGTLFLDEIGDMDMALQTSFLRVLEDGVVTPVGGSHAIQVDVRVVAATNAKLEERISEGSFRSDLYYRLARFIIETPPLRQRRSDIPLLTDHFVTRLSIEMGRSPPSVSDEARHALMEYPFHGNVRELRNIIEGALIESGGRQLEREHLALRRSDGTLQAEPIKELHLATTDTESESADFPLNLRDAEAKLIQRAISLAEGNISEAARILGINRTKLYRRLQVA